MRKITPAILYAAFTGPAAPVENPYREQRDHCLRIGNSSGSVTLLGLGFEPPASIPSQLRPTMQHS